MRLERTREEVLKDKALLLVLFAKVQSTAGALGDRLKMQKLSFLVCYSLFERRIKGLNLTFFTYRWGPFTKDLYDVEADFEEARLIERRGRIFRLTKTGLSLASDLEESLGLLPENADILQTVDSIVGEFAAMSSESLVLTVHKMRVVPVGWHEPEVLEDLPLHLDLTRVLDDEESTAIMEVDAGWLDSFGHVLDSSRATRPYADVPW